MSNTREELTTEVDSEILSALRKLAEKEGRPLHAIVEEALADLIDKHKTAAPRPHVMAEYLASVEAYQALYKKLAE
jgi:predicted transcriptional regulator